MMPAMTEDKTERRLFALRLQAGYKTQVDLANAAGVSRTLIYKAETGRRIRERSAILILIALQRGGIKRTVDDIDWNISSGNEEEE